MTKELLLAEFESPDQLLEAARSTSDAGYVDFDTYSPFPIHGMDDAMRLKPSILGWIVFGGGAFGLIGGFGMQAWMSAVDYKLVIGGKPFFSYPAFIPVTFELMVLFSAFCTVFGMFALNKLPEFYHIIFKSKSFRTATSHGFFLGIESTDSQYDEKKAREFLTSIKAKNIELIKD